MGDVALRTIQPRKESPENGGNLPTGGEPPYDGDMEARVTKLEAAAQDTRDRLVRIEARMENFESTFATKADLHRELGAQTWRIIGAMLTFGTLLTAATFFIARNIH